MILACILFHFWSAPEHQTVIYIKDMKYLRDSLCVLVHVEGHLVDSVTELLLLVLLLILLLPLDLNAGLGINLVRVKPDTELARYPAKS